MSKLAKQLKTAVLLVLSVLMFYPGYTAGFDTVLPGFTLSNPVKPGQNPYLGTVNLAKLAKQGISTNKH